jgi:hypothetical protein
MNVTTASVSALVRARTMTRRGAAILASVAISGTLGATIHTAYVTGSVAGHSPAYAAAQTGSAPTVIGWDDSAQTLVIGWDD